MLAFKVNFPTTAHKTWTIVTEPSATGVKSASSPSTKASMQQGTCKAASEGCLSSSNRSPVYRQHVKVVTCDLIGPRAPSDLGRRHVVEALEDIRPITHLHIQ